MELINNITTLKIETNSNDSNNHNKRRLQRHLTKHAWFPRQISTGHLVNLTTSDVERFQYGGLFVNYLWEAPLESLVILYFGLDQVGVSFLAGFAALALIVPMQVCCPTRAYAGVKSPSRSSPSTPPAGRCYDWRCSHETRRNRT